MCITPTSIQRQIEPSEIFHNQKSTISHVDFLQQKAQELFLGQSMYERLYKVFKKRANSSGEVLFVRN
jgi:hypothetical protein